MSNCPDTNGSDYNVIKHESTEDQSDVVYEISKSSQQSKNKDMIKSEIISDDEQNSSNIISTSNSVNDLQKHNKLYANLRFRTTPDYKSQHSGAERDRRKRTRKGNFSVPEVELLVNLISPYKEIVENKKTDAATNEEKNRIWEHISQIFNTDGASSCLRDAKALRSKWEALKASTKRKVIEIRQGNSPGPPQVLTSVEERIYEIISKFDDNYNNGSIFLRSPHSMNLNCHFPAIDHFIEDTNLKHKINDEPHIEMINKEADVVADSSDQVHPSPPVSPEHFRQHIEESMPVPIITLEESGHISEDEENSESEIVKSPHNSPLDLPSTVKPKQCKKIRKDSVESTRNKIHEILLEEAHMRRASALLEQEKLALAIETQKYALQAMKLELQIKQAELENVKSKKCQCRNEMEKDK